MAITRVTSTFSGADGNRRTPILVARTGGGWSGILLNGGPTLFDRASTRDIQGGSRGTVSVDSTRKVLRDCFSVYENRRLIRKEGGKKINKQPSFTIKSIPMLRRKIENLAKIYKATSGKIFYHIERLVTERKLSQFYCSMTEYRADKLKLGI